MVKVRIVRQAASLGRVFANLGLPSRHNPCLPCPPSFISSFLPLPLPSFSLIDFLCLTGHLFVWLYFRIRHQGSVTSSRQTDISVSASHRGNKPCGFSLCRIRAHVRLNSGWLMQASYCGCKMKLLKRKQHARMDVSQSTTAAHCFSFAWRWFWYTRTRRTK